MEHEILLMAAWRGMNYGSLSQDSVGLPFTSWNKQHEPLLTTVWDWRQLGGSTRRVETRIDRDLKTMSKVIGPVLFLVPRDVNRGRDGVAIKGRRPFGCLFISAFVERLKMDKLQTLVNIGDAVWTVKFCDLTVDQKNLVDKLKEINTKGRCGYISRATTTTFPSFIPPDTVLHDAATTAPTPRVTGVPALRVSRVLTTRVVYLPGIIFISVTTVIVGCLPDISVSRVTRVPTTCEGRGGIRPSELTPRDTKEELKMELILLCGAVFTIWVGEGCGEGRSAWLLLGLTNVMMALTSGEGSQRGDREKRFLYLDTTNNIDVSLQITVPFGVALPTVKKTRRSSRSHLFTSRDLGDEGQVYSQQLARLDYYFEYLEEASLPNIQSPGVFLLVGFEIGDKGSNKHGLGYILHVKSPDFHSANSHHMRLPETSSSQGEQHPYIY
uniref:Uncharacterized protein n=1 Tax=Timema cristinae TaxID=61476 RepID=A0A7R9H2N2_TIMCR|nr:unnamed protein product [Timema cristinae]